MNASGTLTCPRCGTETPWPTRCDCEPKSDGSSSDKASDPVRDALVTLVRLKDAKEWIERGNAPAEVKERYEREKEPAWEAARLALERTPQSAGGTSVDQAVRDAYRSALTYAASLCESKVFDRQDAFDNGCWTCAESIKAELAAINRDNPGDTPVSASAPTMSQFASKEDSERTAIVDQIIRDMDAEGRASVVLAWGKQDGEPTIRKWLYEWARRPADRGATK